MLHVNLSISSHCGILITQHSTEREATVSSMGCSMKQCTQICGIPTLALRKINPKSVAIFGTTINTMHRVLHC